jgi:flavin reductase (DIM6/NTAB) family NADH-FMN oxidoreductase RutF
MQSIDFSTLSPRDKYKILIGSVVPRPIALVTTVDGEGRINAAPFSFFNALSADPPSPAPRSNAHASAKC